MHSSSFRHGVTSSLKIDPQFYGRIIGREGAGLKHIMRETKTYIRVPPRGSNDDAIRITAENIDDDKRAREKINSIVSSADRQQHIQRQQAQAQLDIDRNQQEVTRQLQALALHALPQHPTREYCLKPPQHVDVLQLANILHAVAKSIDPSCTFSLKHPQHGVVVTLTATASKHETIRQAISAAASNEYQASENALRKRYEPETPPPSSNCIIA